MATVSMVCRAGFPQLGLHLDVVKGGSVLQVIDTWLYLIRLIIYSPRFLGSTEATNR